MKNIFSHYSQFCLFILIKGLLGIKDDDYFSLDYLPTFGKKNSNQIKYCKSIPTYHLLSDYWPKLKVLSYNIWGMPELFNWYLDLRGYPKVEYKDERIQDFGGLDLF